MLDAKDIVVGAEVVVTDHLGRAWNGKIKLIWTGTGQGRMIDGYEVAVCGGDCGTIAGYEEFGVRAFCPLPFRDIVLKEPKP